MTTVINIKDTPKDWEKNPDYVYIGRQGKGFLGEWGNPFRLKDEKERNSIAIKYMLWFYKQPQSFRDSVYRVMKGKYLVCFCAPKLCHGDVIKSYINFREKLDAYESSPSK